MVAIPKPTQAELAILRVLWAHGPSTVRQIHDTLTETRTAGTGYTTTLKLVQIMTEKGLLVRTEQGRQHVYRAKHGEVAMQKRLVRDLLDRAFDGSAARLVMHALSAKPASPEELDEIRQLIDQQAKKEQEP